jgi:hypothetical protein
MEIAFGREVGYDDPDVGSARMGDGTARVVDVWLGDHREQRQAVARQAEALTLKALVAFHADVTDPAMTMTVLNDHRQPVVVASTAAQNERLGEFRAGEHAVFAFSFHNMLAPGRYHPLLTITRGGGGLNVIDRFAGGLSFVVSGATASGGMVEIPVQTSVTRQQLPAAMEPQPSGGTL